MRTLGIDIGGKTVKYALTKASDISEKGFIPTPKTFDSLCSSVNEILSSFDADVAGIGVPGLVSGGRILNAPNLGIKDAEFLSALKAKRIALINDAEAAMTAEAAFGAARTKKYAVLISIGTGIGGAILSEGKIYRGNGGAAEIGHMLSYGSTRCSCGGDGCFETVASASALEKKYLSVTGTSLSAEDIFLLSDNGDKTAKELISGYIVTLGNGILSLANILRPEIFILSGGISKRKDLLTEPLKAYAEAHNYGYSGAPAFDIVPARFTADAGIIGAAEYARTCFAASAKRRAK